MFGLRIVPEQRLLSDNALTAARLPYRIEQRQVRPDRGGPVVRVRRHHGRYGCSQSAWYEDRLYGGEVVAPKVTA